mgnify:CR=1 FL=1
MIDFTIPEETREIRDTVRSFVRENCHPAEEQCTAENFDEPSQFSAKGWVLREIPTECSPRWAVPAHLPFAALLF